MASWMTHVFIASQIYNKVNQEKSLDKSYFILGNIAPDLCHDSGVSKEDTHYQEELYDKLDFGKFIYDINKLQIEDEKIASFFKGYLCHMITDDIWLYNIYNTCYRYNDNIYHNEEKNKLKEEDMEELDKYIANLICPKHVNNLVENIDLDIIPNWSWINKDIIQANWTKVLNFLKDLNPKDDYKVKHIPKKLLDSFINLSVRLSIEYIGELKI
ncbi:zinc dependent phospholipase C family protein [Desnuesiella massiliensis]|uniref:zinc dependent phospholipase C family protein n=1 Tax=Desnuesiella massiliensis TaxID=1650662 RepID=UPI0006E302B5|nr:zinc dependent phospholipase C family protein [Desnuesiella massiliensis]